ncbi:MAG: alpha-amylase, partial [Micrococcales bacterium]
LELGSGSFAWLPQFTPDSVLGYRNRDILVIHNFGDTAVHMPAGEIVLRSIAHLDDTNAESTRTAEAISPNETVWLRLH